nr:MAG: hypothetical protein [Chiromantes dehaani nimavirus]
MTPVGVHVLSRLLGEVGYAGELASSKPAKQTLCALLWSSWWSQEGTLKNPIISCKPCSQFIEKVRVDNNHFPTRARGRYGRLS